MLNPAIIRKGAILSALGAALLASGCTSNTTGSSSHGGMIASQVAKSPFNDPGSRARNRAYAARPQPQQFDYSSVYASVADGDITMRAFNYKKMSGKYLRQQVRYFGSEAPGTIVVDVSGPFLYFVQPRGMAMRYGIAVGKEGFGWTGTANVQRKTTWPTWTPPTEMIQRSPKLAKYAEGMPGGTSNPLGARAIYLYKNGKDTLYRIHGTTKPFSIGRKASSGCFRMINQDAADLYARVSPGAKVFVKEYLTEVESR